MLVFEGRDAAGKGGTIKRFMEHLNPRYARSWRWPSPATASRASGTSSATFSTCPTAGEIVMFDRSWYNRAGVERVMGFSPNRSTSSSWLRPRVRADARRQRHPLNEAVVLGDPAEQRTRFIIRQVDPVRQWKLSPMDLESLDKWDDYTTAKEEMFLRTDTDWAPWITVKSNDKKRARINAMRTVLAASTMTARTRRSSVSPTR